jgi:hypothetical protein
MAVLLNLLPNVYWMYKNPSSSMPENNFKIELLKVKELYGITTLIELDTILQEFWNKSSAYINEIKKEMEKGEFSRLLVIYKKLQDAIKKAYLGNAPILISTHKSEFLDVALGVWIYFFHINASMTFDAVIKLLELKIIGVLGMSDSIKKFFALLNI